MKSKLDMKTKCDKCANYEVSLCGTNEICHAFHERTTRFKYGITKDYIKQRLTGEKNWCKEFKRI